MALEAILQAVPPEMIPGLAVKRTAKEAWEANRAMRVGSDRVRKGKVQQLKKEFEMISFRDGDRKSTRLNSSHSGESRMPSSA